VNLRSLRARLLASFLVVIAAALGSVGVSVLLVGPGYFTEAMGHLPGDAMGEAMGQATLVAFTEAVTRSLLAATVIAVVTAMIVGLAVAGRIAGPITALAAAARRLAGGRYAERVAADEPGELGDLGASFNEMAASLEATERRRLQLVGDVAHELRTPLTTLDGYLEGLEDGVITPSAQTWHLLRAETSRLTRMVNDLAELWRAEAHQLPLRIEPLDAAAIARDVALPFAHQAEARGITIAVPGAAAWCRADRDRLAQILSNYLSNAVRHAPHGSTITVTAQVQPAAVRLGVRDEGPGLAPEQLEAVFERFYRVDAARSRAAGGSGIGLAIVRALAEAMDGRAWAESGGAGTGAAFLLELPGSAAVDRAIHPASRTGVVR
jgi:two-component system, OmpR family, sensor histidine kinase BaeS